MIILQGENRDVCAACKQRRPIRLFAGGLCRGSLWTERPRVGPRGHIPVTRVAHGSSALTGDWSPSTTALGKLIHSE